MTSLVALLPDLAPRIPKIKAQLLADLLKHQAQVPHMLMALKAEMPDVDVGLIACQHPALLTAYSVDSLRARLQHMRYVHSPMHGKLCGL